MTLKNSSIKITPVKASKKKNERIVTSIYMVLRNHHHPNRNLKQVIRFEYLYTREGHSIKDILQTGQRRYLLQIKSDTLIQSLNKIEDLNGEEIKGSFYTEELLKAKQDVFRIDKVIWRDYRKKQTPRLPNQALNKWQSRVTK